VKKLASATDPLWYKDAIIYELHVRAFADSNNDGIGDFPGLMSHLDYLQDLGVTCIWLLPFFPSPLRDDGYDIANYVDVNPSYGTLADFKAFLDAAHHRNMQVMIELVINHTSDQHPWFKAARTAPPGSPAREMYVWSNSDQLYKDARIIFTDTEKSNWTWDEVAKAYYWHRFFSHQPDLNFDNPQVIQEVLNAMHFWLDMGVDALRMDAIPYLVERDGTSCENLPETHAAIKAIRAAIDDEYANRLILAEANQWPSDVRPYFGDGDECHMAFHFPLMPRIYMALRQEDRLPITDIMAQTPAIPDNCQWGLFLRNHDELTLEMVTDDERDYMYLAYSADPRMRINVGIRRRLAPLVDNNRRRIELLNSLLLSFPGTPIMYYGDEIGMGDNIYLGDRNGVRTPMQWNSDRNAGFSKCDPARLYFPVVMDPIYGYQVVNVEAQLSDQSSLLHWTRNMIALRKLFQVFGRGTLVFLNPANRKILSYLRDLDRGDGSHETVLCVANLSRFAQPVSLDLSAYAGFQPVEMLGYVAFPPIDHTPYALTLAPYSFLWLELQPAGIQTEPTAVPVPTSLAAEMEETGVSETIAQYLLNEGWAGLAGGKGLALLESALFAWLPLQRWFGAKTRKIQRMQILNWIEIPALVTIAGGRSLADTAALPPALFFFEIVYEDGSSDTYHLPLALTMNADADELTLTYPRTVIASLATPAGTAVLHDATAREDFRSALLQIIQQDVTLPLMSREQHLPGTEISPVPRDAQPGEAAEAQPSDDTTSLASAEPPKPLQDRLSARASTPLRTLDSRQSYSSRIASGEQSNTSILYGNQLILKLFRRLQPGENPDVEIGRYLTEVARFNSIAPLLGDIGIVSANSESTTVAMLQSLVANEGDGWQWFLAQLDSFFSAVASLPAPYESHAASFLYDREPNAEALEYARPSLEAAAILGRRTAEMHLALAAPSEDPAFAPEPLTHADLASDAKRIGTQITSTLETLKTKLSTLKDLTADDAGLLLSRRINLFARANAITSFTPAGLRFRIHGDYHLGQTLRTARSMQGADTATLSSLPGDFVLLDFEGEPARPLAERRQKQSPLKDVAGMLRSFSYAAYTGLDRYAASQREAARANESDALAAWALLWQNSVSSEFLRAYRATIAANPAILPSPEQSQSLLGAYLLEKALYEMLYELNNRPAWLRIPLAGILSL
jgi:maltose alpha-D-glucosyltransferase/alpha-amylase